MKKTLSALLTVSIMLSMASCKTGSNQTTNTTNIINESESTVNTDISETSETTEATKVTANSTEETQIVDEQYLYMKYAQMSPEEITASLTLEQKAAQMQC